jgi:hypothetical protein
MRQRQGTTAKEIKKPNRLRMRDFLRLGDPHLSQTFSVSMASAGF